MERKLKRIYEFLINNRTYNKSVQENFYISVITPYKTVEDKVIALLYNIANTQSQPKIDNLSEFFKFIIKTPNCMNSFEGFVNEISSEEEKTYRNLYNGLRNQKGWGNKTSALFTKTIFHLHNGNYRGDLKIWDDTPQKIYDYDDFYLPVDSVIISIFNKLNQNKNWNFENINKIIKEFYHRDEIEVWDDLWFWGFITQKGSGTNREFEWNENKYWMMKESDKSEKKIMEIKSKADDFLRILKEIN